MRLMHHSMSHSKPPTSFKCNAEDGYEEYTAPGGHTMVALFTVFQVTTLDQKDVAGTSEEATWAFINAVRNTPEGISLGAKIERKTRGKGNKAATYSEVSVSPLVIQLIAGAPTLAIVLQNARPALGFQVCIDTYWQQADCKGACESIVGDSNLKVCGADVESSGSF